MKIVAKIIVGVLAFILLVAFVIIPLALPWVVSSQGTKLLKHPVKLRGAEFNPLLLQLTLHDLEILDSHDRLMVGFDKLFIEVSPFELFKKVCHVKAIQMAGLKVNAELLPGNRINLMDLVPPMPAAGAKPATARTPAQPQPLPMVIIDRIDLYQGQVHFIDKTIKPEFTTTASAMELHITHVTTNPKDQTKIKFHADLDEKGRIAMETIIEPLAQPLEMETTVSLNSYALNVLTPYVGKYMGRQLHSGNMDLVMDYRISNNRLTATHKFLIQQFAFGNSVESKDAMHLPFGLAIALLEDPQGRINIALPVSGNLKDPKFEYWHLVGQVVRNFFIKLVTKPFSFMASALGASESSTDELGYVRFEPGKSDLLDSQKHKLATLIKGLKQHPRLRLEIDGSYDPQMDWKAIQADSFTKDYDLLRKNSTRPDAKVYQLLYQRRFGILALWNLAKKYKTGIGSYDDVKLDREIKRQLIADAPPDTNALDVLAKARAQLIYDFLVSSGFDARHLNMGHPQPTQSTMGYVPLEFTLTVFDK